MSLYRGLVTDVADPEGLLRVKARVPSLYGSNESDWMWPSIPLAMGVQVPDVGDPVWVMLESGDRERPVWVGTWRTRPQGGLDPDLIFGGVVGETTYGLAPTNGLAYTVSRSDHTHGSPALTGSTPTAIDPDDGAAVGVGTTPARHDHQHAIVAAIAGTILPDDTAAEGVATSFSRSDHQHAISAVAPGTSVLGDTAAEGVSVAFSRADHRHDRLADVASGSTKRYAIRTYARATFR